MEDFVPYEIAKKLKEKGYPQEPKNRCQYYEWDGLRNIHPLCTEIVWYESENKTHLYSAPTISQVLKWLREEKKIFIDIRTSIDLNGKEHFSYYIIHNKVSIREGYTDFDWNFEQAALAGISWTLDNLI